MNGDETDQRLDWVDIGLVLLFLVGIYTHLSIQVSDKVPFPSALAGIAGMVMLWRRRADITLGGFVGFVIVVLLYLASVLSAPDLMFLGRRVNGLIQLTYSMVIGFALFLTVTKGDREQIERLFLFFSLAILIGCLLEDYGGLKPISDAVRDHIYSG